MFALHANHTGASPVPTTILKLIHQEWKELRSRFAATFITRFSGSVITPPSHDGMLGATPRTSTTFIAQTRIVACLIRLLPGQFSQGKCRSVTCLSSHFYIGVWRNSSAAVSETVGDGAAPSIPATFLVSSSPVRTSARHAEDRWSEATCEDHFQNGVYCQQQTDPLGTDRQWVRLPPPRPFFRRPNLNQCSQ